MNLVQIIRNRGVGLWKPIKAQSCILDLEHRSFQLSETIEFNQESHTASITSVAVDSDVEQYVLAGLGDGTLTIHLIKGEVKKDGFGYKSKVEWRAGKTHAGRHKHGIGTVSWFTDNGIFLTSGRDGKLKVWDTNAGSVVEEFNMEESIHHHSLASPDLGPLIGVASANRNVVLVDMGTGAACHTLRGHKGEVNGLAWSPSNFRILATASSDRKIMLWDVRQAKCYLSYFDYNNVRFKRSKDLKFSGESHQGGVHGVHFSPCGRYLYSIGSDKRIRKWDAVTMKNLKTKFPQIETKQSGNTPIQSIEGGNLDLIFVPEENLINLLDSSTGKSVRSLAGHFSKVYTLSYSKRNSVLYSGGRDRFILEWDSSLMISAARAAKVVDEVESDCKNTKLKQFTVDTWSSSEDET